MTNNNNSTDDFDELDQDITLDNSLINKRISVRYRRDDIEATLKIRTLFFAKEIPVQIRDISSKGAAITCEIKLKPKRRVCLFVKFPDQKSFAVNAVVVHNLAAPRYGLRFDRYEGELAEHLLETQTNLDFS
ncbi:MAG: PilZ domain-containing protein [Gammaproteobacteria bacterium]